MIPEIGHFSLILALTLALVQGVVPLIGAARGVPEWMRLPRPAPRGPVVFVAIAFGCLAWSFAANDFSVVNVATNSNSQLPLHYRIAATWGSHEGSLLLWVLMLGVWTVAVTVFSRRLPDEMVERGLLPVHPPHVQPVGAPVAAGRRRPRPQPVAAGSRHGDPPAHAVHGLC